MIIKKRQGTESLIRFLRTSAVWKYGSYIISNIRLNNSITQMNWQRNWSEFVVMKRPRIFEQKMQRIT